MATTASTLRQHHLAEDYEDIQDLVRWTIHRFMERYGGDFAELQSEGNWAFMAAHQQFDGRRAKFSTFVGYKVWKQLLEARRESARKLHWQAKSLDSAEGKEAWNKESERTFPLHEFLEELTDDARIVAKLAVDTPLSLTKLMVERGGTGTQRRQVLKGYLEGLGWTAKRIAESFSEIAEVLKQFP